jgi:ABC-type nitrate/sulfonate/bicarbonate transport system substrate-binding protein
MTRLSYSRCPAVPTVSALAHQLGLIEEELKNEPGIEPEFVIAGFSPKVDYGHEDRYWLRNAGHAPALWKRAKGVDARIVGLSFLEGSYPVFSLASSGIGSVADLKGKRLAVVGRKVRFRPDGQSAAQDLSHHAGHCRSDAGGCHAGRSGPGPPPADAPKQDIFQHLFTSRLALLQDGVVDAVTATIPPDIGAFPQLNILYDTRQHPDPRERVNPSVLRGLVVSAALIEERRDLVVRILARLLEAADWAIAHPLGDPPDRARFRHSARAPCLDL